MTTKQVKSVCPYCGVGCGIVMDVEGGRVVKVSGDKTHPANFGRLCTKGATSAAAIAESGRLASAHKRDARGLAPSPVGMRRAIRETAGKLRAILDEHGPDALSFYVSGQMSLEAQYLVNKLAKGYVRTVNIESNSRLCMASAGSGYKLSLGADGPPGSYEDFDRTDLFFVIGANMADCHPILFLRMMDRVKAGAKLIVVDPRRTATADKASLFLQIRPGTDLALLNGLLHLLHKQGAVDETFVAAYTTGWEDMPAFLDAYDPASVAQATGIPEADIRRAAAWIAEAPEWISCWTMGLNQSTHGTWQTNAVCNLHLATGAICRPGSGPFSLTGQPNAMGGREMGYMGPGLPGQRSALVEEDRRFAEDLWRLPRGTLRAETGPGTVAMFERMAAGDIKACWIICTNPVASVPNRGTVIAGLEAAELVVAQDVFLETETNAYADYLLPGALWAEAEGVMINSERNLTLMRKAVDPPGEALPDWMIVAQVACEMGFADAFSYASSEDVYRELQRAWNPKTGYDLRGAGYDRLGETPVQWPAAADGPSRNPVRYLNDGAGPRLAVREDGSVPRIVFPTPSGKAAFFARPFLPPAEMPDAERRFVLNTGRVQHQWHTLTKTGKIAALNKLNPGPFVEIHPEDAAELGIRERDLVEIASRRGKAVLPAVVTDRVMPGGCFAPFHWNDLFGPNLAVNAVTSDAADPVSLQPELKFCAVSLRRTTRTQANQERTGGDPVGSPALEPADWQPAAEASAALFKEEIFMAKVDTLANMLGIESGSPMTLDQHEKMYVAGFIASLRTDEAAAAAGVPVLPPTAPLEPSKRLWLDGILAGMFSRAYLPAADYGSGGAGQANGSAVWGAAAPMSGAAIAEAAAAPAGVPDARRQSGAPAGARPAEGTRTGVTILWASQTGTAEAAAIECARRLQLAGNDVRLVSMDAYDMAELPSERLVVLVASTFGAGDPPDNGARFWQALSEDSVFRLEALRYAVLAFGDSSYDQFCGFGRSLDERLGQLGAKRLLDRADCDAGGEDALDAWHRTLESEVKALRAIDPAAEPADRHYDRNHPLPAKLLAARPLNGPGSEKDTRHYVFDLKGTGLRYEAGDALGVWPTNDPETVADILDSLRLPPDAEVHVKGERTTLGAALLKQADITRITPALLELVRDRSGSDRLAALLRDDAKQELKKWLWGRQPADLLREFPTKAGAEELLAALRPLQPRLYSIASSAAAHPGEVHIAVSTVRYEQNGKLRKGVCSVYLAERADEAAEVPIFVQKAPHFRPPADPAAPMIMVGAGTGVGPFRGFLQERRASSAVGRNWLFFGEQREACDFYFREELEDMRDAGVLHRLTTAFSRDQKEKVYVQHRMLEHGAELWAWLKAGAHFYVCGDAGMMAKEVEAALKQIIQRHGGMNEAEAGAYIREMARAKRYARDVY
ncbi:sulfite reductase (NADPH) flavoprotein alpha-component [Paenibacillus sp. UNC496MF]|uniref:sulfite reductase subunit alpha n=1 Tax=Paenibacillus sp. UNC496MF TaxID=1502753 RepID=UPI0008EA6B63|nr:sulfite reductase subunit alpha [Paenibacillus sp. UNC496MF]SFI49098.1 sulfite reductase (NADPH) flavoprotein alpha-component [Paenibacillus sp. UNC496MF]